MPKTMIQRSTKLAVHSSKNPQQARSRQRYKAKLRPVEGLWIPAASRAELTRFWKAHLMLRRGCLRKYGFDPIDEEEAYWRFGLAEPDHREVLRAVRRNGNRFSLALVKRWEIEELRDAS